MKKLLVILTLLVLIVAVGIGCHRSKGGGEAPPETSTTLPPSGSDIPIPVPGPGPSPATPPVVFSSAQQAAQGTASLSGTLALADAQFDVAVALGAGSTPPGFAPSLFKSSGNIGNVDPTLASMVQDMSRFARLPSIQKAVNKVRAMRTMRAASVSTTLTTDACPGGGSAAITGQNTFDEVVNPLVESNYDIVFTACQDDVMFTQLDGSIHIDDSQRIADPADPLANEHISRMISNNLASKESDSAGTLIKTSVMNGTFVNDDHVTTAIRDSTGTFVVTTAASGQVGTFTYDGLVSNITKTHNADGSDSTATSTKGTFKANSATGGVTGLQISVAVDLTKQSDVANDLLGTRKEKLNGSVDINYDGSPASCQALTGKLTITTADTAPKVFTSASPACPLSGSVSLNNSTVSYGSGIQVTLDSGATQPFTDCSSLDAQGGSCKF